MPGLYFTCNDGRRIRVKTIRLCRGGGRLRLALDKRTCRGGLFLEDDATWLASLHDYLRQHLNMTLSTEATFYGCLENIVVFDVTPTFIQEWEHVSGLQCNKNYHLFAGHFLIPI